MKLDRLMARHVEMGRVAAVLAISAGRVRINQLVVRDRHAEADRFDEVCLDSVVIQRPQRALYLMLHKPVGWLSATQDAEHPTVIDLIDDPDRTTLHLAGRLDRSTSGLVLLTNDGRWSKRLMAAGFKVPKVYRLETHEPIPPTAVEAFAEGFYFHTEDIHTLPATLEITGPRQARVTLHEGRYHQIKRMFHRLGCRLTSLHREGIGQLQLPDSLPVGAWRALTSEEIQQALSPDPPHSRHENSTMAAGHPLSGPSALLG